MHLLDVTLDMNASLEKRDRQDGISMKKWAASSFWSNFQKMIGAWFDTDRLTVSMPKHYSVRFCGRVTFES